MATPASERSAEAKLRPATANAIKISFFIFLHLPRSLNKKYDARFRTLFGGVANDANVAADFAVTYSIQPYRFRGSCRSFAGKCHDRAPGKDWSYINLKLVDQAPVQ